jgi:hypothetical protein
VVLPAALTTPAPKTAPYATAPDCGRKSRMPPVSS